MYFEGFTMMPVCEKSYTIKIGVRAVVTRQNETGTYEVLIGQRPMTSKMDAGKWSLPGGKPLVDEDMIDCAARELLEETGLIAQLAEIVHLEYGWYDGDLIISFFVHIGQWDGDLVCPPGQEQWQWCSLDGLPDNFMANTQKFFQTGIMPYILQAGCVDSEHDEDCGDCQG
jgi:8-oxo-dGTP pyrophosphatase MutT (NUDIX family)